MNEVLTRGNLQLLPANNNELKNRITNWLLEEGATFSQEVDEGVEFRLRVVWGYNIDVVKEKGRTRIGNTATMGFQDEKVVKAINKLTKKQKQDFFTDLQKELVKFPTRFIINPPSLDRLDSVFFDHHVYLEDLTKTDFFNSLELIRRSMVFLYFFATVRLDIDLAAPSSPDNKAGVA